MTTESRNAVCYSAMYVAESLAPVIRQSPFEGVPSKIMFRLIFVFYLFVLQGTEKHYCLEKK